MRSRMLFVCSTCRCWRTDPTSFSTTQYRESKKITAPHTELILVQSHDYSYDVVGLNLLTLHLKEITAPLTELILVQSHHYSYIFFEQLEAKNKVKLTRRKMCDGAATSIKDMLSLTLQRAMSLFIEKGASRWLTVLPLEKHNFYGVLFVSKLQVWKILFYSLDISIYKWWYLLT